MLSLPRVHLLQSTKTQRSRLPAHTKPQHLILFGESLVKARASHALCLAPVLPCADKASTSAAAFALSGSPPPPANRPTLHTFQPSARPGLAQTLNPPPGRCHQKPKATPSFRTHPPPCIDDSTTANPPIPLAQSHSFSAASSAPHSFPALSHASTVAHHCHPPPTPPRGPARVSLKPLHTGSV